jgi:hypothetical protein
MSNTGNFRKGILPAGGLGTRLSSFYRCPENDLEIQR